MPKIQEKSITMDEARNRASVTIKEFAQLTGLSATAAYHNALSGKIESRKVCGRRVIPVSYLLQIAGETR